MRARPERTDEHPYGVSGETFRERSYLHAIVAGDVSDTAAAPPVEAARAVRVGSSCLVIA